MNSSDNITADTNMNDTLRQLSQDILDQAQTLLSSTLTVDQQQAAEVIFSNADQLFNACIKATQAKPGEIGPLAHDIRNFLTPITGYTYFLSCGSLGALDDDQTGNLDTIETCMAHFRDEFERAVAAYKRSQDPTDIMAAGVA